MDNGNTDWSTPEADVHTSQIPPISIQSYEAEAASSRQGSPEEGGGSFAVRDVFQKLPDKAIQL